MEITKEQIRSIVITRIPFAIINSKGKMKYPFISSNASEQVVNALVNGIYEELSKLHQPTVSDCTRCKTLEMMIDNGLGWEDMKNDITYPRT